MWASTVGNVNSPGPMPVGLIVTNAVDVLISSIRIFRNKEFLIHWIQALYVAGSARICGGLTCLPPMPLHVFVSRDHTDKGKSIACPMQLG